MVNRNRLPGIITNRYIVMISCILMAIIITFCSSVLSSNKTKTYEKQPKLHNVNATAGVVLVISTMQKEANVIAKQDESTNENIDKVAIDENKNIILVSHAGNVPVGAPGCKSYKITYEPVRLITCKSAPAYKATHDEGVYTDVNTSCLMKDGKYLVAIGTGYGFNVGDAITITVDNGEMVDAIVGDFKDDADTDNATHKYHNEDGSVVELIIDDNYEYHKPECFDGNVIDIQSFID